MNNKNSLRNTFLMIVALPPPVHGQSKINEALFKCIQEIPNIEVITCNISPITSSRNLTYHINRLSAVLSSVFKIILLRKRDGLKCYIVFESGFGVAYNILVALTARLLGVALLIHHHTSLHTLKISRLFSVLLWFLRADTMHIVLSKNMELNLRENYKNMGSVLCLNNSAFLVGHEDVARIDPFRIGILSNLSESKGTILAISTYRQFRTLGGVGHLVVAGPILDRATNSAIKDVLKDFPQDVSYLGPLDDFSKDQFFRQLSVTIFPSLYKYEAQPLVVLESLSYGRPCLALSAGYIGEILKDTDWICYEKEKYSIWASKILLDWSVDGVSLMQAGMYAKSIFRKSNSEGKAQLDIVIKKICEVSH